jgi:hypothetical protein
MPAQSIQWNEGSDLDCPFSFLFLPIMEFGDLRFKVVKVETAGQEVIAAAGNLIVARAALDVSVSLWPSAGLELRQGACIIEKSGAPAD